MQQKLSATTFREQQRDTEMQREYVSTAVVMNPFKAGRMYAAWSWIIAIVCFEDHEELNWSMRSI